MTAAPVVSAATGEKAHRRRGGTGVLCLTLLGVTLAALGHVAVQTKHIEVAGALGSERARHKTLVEEEARLRSEISRLKHPARIEQLARDRLNMGAPDLEKIRRLGR